MSELTPEDQAVLDAAEAWGAESTYDPEQYIAVRRNLRNAVDARRKARESEWCKHCGDEVNLADGRYWYHLISGDVRCHLPTYADPR